MRYFILIILCAAMFGCNKHVTSGQNGSGVRSEVETYEQKAYEVMGIPQISFEENETEEYVLATFKDERGVSNSNPLQYAVLKISDNSLVKKGVLPQGSVKWVDSYILEIVAPPGMPEGNKTIEDYTTQFNVKTGEPILKVQMKR